jgi:hypothetical protein
LELLLLGFPVAVRLTWLTPGTLLELLLLLGLLHEVPLTRLAEGLLLKLLLIILPKMLLTVFLAVLAAGLSLELLGLVTLLRNSLNKLLAVSLASLVSGLAAPSCSRDSL